MLAAAADQDDDGDAAGVARMIAADHEASVEVGRSVRARSGLDPRGGVTQWRFVRPGTQLGASSLAAAAATAKFRFVRRPNVAHVINLIVVRRLASL